MKQTKINREQLRIIMAKCDLSPSSVYRLIATGNRPDNKLVAAVWDRTLLELGLIGDQNAD